MNEQTEIFWRDFCEKHDLPLDTPVQAWSFGMDDETADKMVDLVMRGIKTAITSSFLGYNENDPMPKVGDYSIVLDSSKKPVCVIQDKVVEVMPYNHISRAYAYLEGEGARSYNYWRKTHDEYFKQEFKEYYQTRFIGNELMVCEVFEKID